MLKNFILSVDSSVCLTQKEIDQNGIVMAHLSYTLDGKEYVDAFENDAQKQAFYDKLSHGSLAQSSKVNPESFKNAWSKPLEQGYDILHLSLSSRVSGSYESACQVAAELSEKNGRRIEIIDTKNGKLCGYRDGFGYHKNSFKH